MDYKFNYQLLSRLQQDCEYFLNNGQRNTKHLWGMTVQNHIAEMYKQYDLLPEKPVWLTRERILEYERQMLQEEN